MPSNVVKAYAKKTDKSTKEVEDLWDEVKAMVKKEYPDIDPDSDRYWALVNGIVKKHLKLEHKLSFREFISEV